MKTSTEPKTGCENKSDAFEQTSPSFADLVARSLKAAATQLIVLFSLVAILGTMSTGTTSAHFALAVFFFGAAGALALGRGVKAESSSNPAEAVTCYSAALTNYLVSFLALIVYKSAGSSLP